MNALKMKKLIQERIDDGSKNFIFDREKDTLRVENKQTKLGITISLPDVVAKWQNQKDKAIDEVVYYIEEALIAMNQTLQLEGKEKSIFPVIRSTSFPQETKAGITFFTDEHTAETRIFYAIDLDNTYRLIDENMIKRENWDKHRIREVARFNVKRLSTESKRDEVSGNIFYFLNTNDGYDASRILNDTFLRQMESEIEGEMAVAVPHQDVLIIADIRNETGYDILAQLTMSFFTNGYVPITSLSFIYENGDLEPIFILGKNRRK